MSIPFGRTKQVNDDRSSDAAYYRCQVEMPDNLLWGILYNFLKNVDKTKAHEIRDFYGPNIQTMMVNEIKRRMTTEQGRWVMKNWLAIDKNLANTSREEVMALLDHYGISVE